MTNRILFKPHEYSDLTEAERQLLTEGYQKAIDALYRNITSKGFSACSLADNTAYGTDVNYRSVWARDSAMTLIWSLDLDHEPIRECQAATLHTLFSHQSPNGQIPANVSIDTDIADYSGVGGIASIDSGLWVIIAMFRFANETGDWSIVDEYNNNLQRDMDWLGAHDSNNCGLLEIPEEGFILQPGQLYLGVTEEYTETHNSVPFLEGKSSVGRLGIDIHATAGKGDVGFCNTWTLEISCTQPVRVYAGMPIGQLIYFRVEGDIDRLYNRKSDAKYNARTDKPVESMMWRNKF